MGQYRSVLAPAFHKMRIKIENSRNPHVNKKHRLNITLHLTLVYIEHHHTQYIYKYFTYTESIS
jgi:hypothetical protein